jgi:hypothetical protein
MLKLVDFTNNSRDKNGIQLIANKRFAEKNNKFE